MSKEVRCPRGLTKEECNSAQNAAEKMFGERHDCSFFKGEIKNE